MFSSYGKRTLYFFAVYSTWLVIGLHLRLVPLCLFILYIVHLYFFGASVVIIHMLLKSVSLCIILN